jgi:hypothetical protein
MKTRMSQVGKFLVVLFPAVFTSNVVLAWDDFGHEVVAQIAHDTLAKESPTAQRKLDSIIQADPRPMRKNLFVCAIWPDLNKHHNEVPNVPAGFFDGAPVEGSWHFVDVPYGTTNATAITDFINIGGVTPDPTQPDTTGNVVIAIRLYQTLLKNSLTSSGPTLARDQADYVSWLLHYIGDVHQPLHCVTVTGSLANYTPPASGDRGGNGFRVSGLGKITELHAFWDDQLDLADRENGLKEDHLNPDANKISSVASQIETDQPRTKFAQQLTKTDPADWATESHSFCVEVYALTPKKKPGVQYVDFANGTAEERIALAGYRLAAVLKSALE